MTSVNELWLEAGGSISICVIVAEACVGVSSLLGRAVDQDSQRVRGKTAGPTTDPAERLEACVEDPGQGNEGGK